MSTMKATMHEKKVYLEPIESQIRANIRGKLCALKQLSRDKQYEKATMSMSIVTSALCFAVLEMLGREE